jgi:HemY protein
LQQKERAAHAALLDAISHFMAGRFLRARKSAQTALEKEALMQAAGLKLDHAVSLRTLSHIMAAESAHALQDKDLRQHHLAQAVVQAQVGTSQERQTLTEGAQLRAARWLLDDRDAEASLDRLKELPPARLAGQPAMALDTAVLLAKHRAFTPAAAESLVRGLIMNWLVHLHDADAVLRMWQGLTPAQRGMPDVAAEVAMRFMRLGGSAAVVRPWLQVLWMPLQSPQMGWTPDQVVRVVRAIETSLTDPSTADARPWLARIEAAQQAQPRDPNLQYLAGMVCMRHQLWGKAQLLLAQAVKGLEDPVLLRRSWRALAELAEQRADAVQAAQAWKQAALVSA